MKKLLHRQVTGIKQTIDNGKSIDFEYLEEVARGVLGKLPDNGFGRTSARTLSASAIYVAGILSMNRLTQEEIRAGAKVGTSAIREGYRKIAQNVALEDIFSLVYDIEPQ